MLGIFNEQLKEDVEGEKEDERSKKTNERKKMNNTDVEKNQKVSACCQHYKKQ